MASGAALLLLSACSGQQASPVGTWGEEGNGLPNLTLAEDGKLTGTDGCNRLMGSWEADGADVTFGQVATTMMACQDVDTWLSGLSTATVDGDVLRVSDADGTEIGTLTRG